MKLVNTRGVALAKKHVLMVALAYNLKKFLKFINKRYAANFIAIPDRKENYNEDTGHLLCVFIIFLLIINESGTICLRNQFYDSQS